MVFGKPALGPSVRRWCAVAVGALVLAVAAPGARAAAWVTQPAPVPSFPDGGLTRVSCLSPSQCVAVGGTAAGGALVEQWNGSHWSIQPTPAYSYRGDRTTTSLNDVSCASANRCFAAGTASWTDAQRRTGTVGLVERRNGRQWTVVQTIAAHTTQSLTGISCPSAHACLAVGSIGNLQTGTTAALVDRWNGSRWSITRLTARGRALALRAVVCRSASECTAVGDVDFAEDVTKDNAQPLVERWDGRRWTRVTTPPATGSSLDSVSCPAPTACMAVGGQTPGFETQVLALRWNGVRWSRTHVHSPKSENGAALNDVSCTSQTACTAVGSSNLAATLAERWNGKLWSVEKTPHANGMATLLGVACPTRSVCVGTGQVQVLATSTLATRWSHGLWRLQATPTPLSTGSVTVSAVSCPAATDCVAVGTVTVPALGLPVTVPLIESWNGARWVIDSSPQVSGTLDGVSCVSASDCLAVGSRVFSGSADWLAEVWNGSAWTTDSPPLPIGFESGSLAGVSCPAPSACVAVGLGVANTFAFPLGAAFDGHQWTTSSPPLGNAPGPVAVSCASPTACLAVGSVADGWNGSAWSALTAPSRAGNAVSCASATACMSVGDPDLEELWNGTTWTGEATPFSNGTFNGVSCVSATACTAVGDDGSHGARAAFWNGTTWAQQPTPNPAGGATVAGVACLPTACTAVGNTTGGRPFILRYS